MPARRSVLKGAAAMVLGTSGVAIAPAAARAAVDPDSGLRLVLLGTAAGPGPFQGRTGIASALVVDGAVYLIDLGHGAFDQFAAAGLHPGDLSGVFVTHLHSDHLADLYSLPWLRFGGTDSLTKPLPIWGPGPAGALPEPRAGASSTIVAPGNPTPGTADFLDLCMQATAYDLNIRVRDSGWPDPYTMVVVHEIDLPDIGASAPDNITPAMEPFEIMSDSRVRVSAILVEHPPVFPSFGFRFDTEYGSVVFSGDTTITENMVTLASGADVLVHEAIDLQALELAEGGLSQAQIEHLTSSHADVTRLGALAQRAGVRTLVLSHLAPGMTTWPDTVWRAKAKKGFDGKVVVGTDLLSMVV